MLHYSFHALPLWMPPNSNYSAVVALDMEINFSVSIVFIKMMEKSA